MAASVYRDDPLHNSTGAPYFDIADQFLVDVSIADAGIRTRFADGGRLGDAWFA